MKVSFLNYLIIFIIAFFFPASPGSPADRTGESYETPYATIYYYHEDKSDNLAGNLSTTTSIFKKDNEKNIQLIEGNIYYIVYRVKKLTGMFPADLHFSIQVYKNDKDLTHVFMETGMTGDAPIAFYSHKNKTIYLSAEKLNDSVFAHEVAHAVINSYFSTPPPAQMQEILAHYVEKHLWDNYTHKNVLDTLDSGE